MKLQLFLRDSINPRNLAGQQISEEEFSTWRSFLNEQIAGIKLAIQNQPSIGSSKETGEIKSVVSTICF